MAAGSRRNLDLHGTSSRYEGNQIAQAALGRSNMTILPTQAGAKQVPSRSQGGAKIGTVARSRFTDWTLDPVEANAARLGQLFDSKGNLSKYC